VAVLVGGFPHHSDRAHHSHHPAVLLLLDAP